MDEKLKKFEIINTDFKAIIKIFKRVYTPLLILHHKKKIDLSNFSAWGSIIFGMDCSGTSWMKSGSVTQIRLGK